MDAWFNTDQGFLFIVSVLLVQLAGLLAVVRHARTEAKTRERFLRGVYGILKKIEGLTADRRTQMLFRYDQLVERLQRRLPTIVANRISAEIEELESGIISRLSAIDADLLSDGGDPEELEQLLKTMERLERAVLTITTDTVRESLNEGRQVFSSQSSSDMEEAA